MKNSCRLFLSGLGVSLFMLSGCSGSGGGGSTSTSSNGNPTSDKPIVPGATPPPAQPQIVEEMDCKKWDFSKHTGLSDLSNAGIAIQIDCDSINKNISGNVYDARNWRETLIPSTLDELAKNIDEIKALRLKPKTILLSLYFSRDFGDGKWVLRPTNENNRPTFFVERERAFQPIERELFSDKIKLISGGAPIERDVSYSDLYHRENLAKAVSTLKKLKPALSDKVSYVYLPLGTNFTDDFLSLRFDSKSKVLTLPYEANQESLNDFIARAIPAQSKFQSLIGDIYVFSTFRIFYTDMEYNDQARDPKVERTKRIVTRYVDTFERLAKLSKEIKDVHANKKFGSLWLNSVSADFNLNILHTLSSERLTLNVTEVERNGFGVKVFSEQPTKDCLKFMASAEYAPNKAVCQPAF